MSKLENLIKFTDIEEIDIDEKTFKTKSGRLYYYMSSTFQWIYVPLTALTHEQTEKIIEAIKAVLNDDK
jgi:hypothetical protein